MTWFKVDDGFLTHRKSYGIKDGPLALWVRAGNWCAKELTDGRIPETALRGLNARPVNIADLVKRGLWENAPDGAYQFHNWLKWQPSREQVLARRESTLARVQRSRSKKPSSAAQVVANDTETAPEIEAEETHQLTDGCNGVTNEAVTAAPGPGPVPKEEEKIDIYAGVAEQFDQDVEPANDAPPQLRLVRERPPLPPDPPNLPPPEPPLHIRLHDEFAKRYAVKFCSFVQMDERPAKKFGKWCEDSYAAQGVSDAFALGLRTLENFFSTGDRWTVENGHPFAHLAKSPTKFLKPWAASQKPLATARRGPAAVSSIEAFEEDARRIAAGESLF